MSVPSIVFFGTPPIAVPTLERLHRDWSVSAVVTLPDAPAGRGRHRQSPAVKVAAERLGIRTIFQPQSLSDAAFVEQLAALDADIFCVFAFRILPRVLLGLPSLAFNVHPSLLPKFRGPAPIAHTIIAGELQTGVTTFVLSEKVDAGMILLQESLSISDGLTAGELAEILAPRCADLASRTIAAWMNGTLVPTPQDERLATAAPKLHPETAWIDWRRDCRTVRNWIHGHSPQPGAWTLMDGTRLKVYRARLIEEESSHQLAGVWRMTDSAWQVACGRGTLELHEIQLPGKRAVAVADFLRGWRGHREGVFSLPEQKHDGTSG
ncbi:MAG: methionyl-tRNA formyltransferase [Chlorobi bacterium]|nr:methionyl-tRNA formyltransferase [Chlorobiota bacterium]